MFIRSEHGKFERNKFCFCYSLQVEKKPIFHASYIQQVNRWELKTIHFLHPFVERCLILRHSILLFSLKIHKNNGVLLGLLVRINFSNDVANTMYNYYTS